MFRARKVTWAAAAGITAAALVTLGLPAGPAHSATLACNTTESCGGANLAYAGHGPLSLAILGPSTVNGGFGYNNEEVGFTTSGATDGSQDFTVFQNSTEPTGHGGYYGFGDYVAVYTHGGKLPFDLSKCAANTPAAGETSCGAASADVNIPYCISVEDTYPTVSHHVVQRWALVLRNCFAWAGTTFIIGHKAPGEIADTVVHPDLYQEWSPTETGDNYLEFQDLALNTTFYRHGWASGHSFVMDDRAWGGSGTWGLAYPELNQLNQKFKGEGCTLPLDPDFNPAFYNCPV